jgi:hypothetical protein
LNRNCLPAGIFANDRKNFTDVIRAAWRCREYESRRHLFDLSRAAHRLIAVEISYARGISRLSGVQTGRKRVDENALVDQVRCEGTHKGVYVTFAYKM